MHCPHGCGFAGTDDEVDDHRVAGHRDGPQAGSNLPQRPRANREGPRFPWFSE